MLSRKTSWRKNVNEKEKISSYLIYNIISFSKMAGKADFFHESKLNMNL